ncbi:hypothetical protein HDU91_002650 [Kappamyces sp. JEL0680]|nr:hypothetical protein HDU91_002650 [Kappamyces sp. JEL0680]
MQQTSARERRLQYFQAQIQAFNSVFFEQKLQTKRDTPKLLPIEPRIKVCIRKRPLSKKETARGDFDILTVQSDHYPQAHCYLHETKTKFDLTPELKTHKFLFDSVYDQGASNSSIAKDLVGPLVENFLDGGKSTLFAFGATGSGKTHTMFGSSEERGLIFHVASQIMASVRDPLELSISFVEIYKGKIFDLLAKRRQVKLLDDDKGIAVLHGHVEVIVDDFSMLEDLIAIGMDTRTVGSTDANSESSRSHAVFQLSLARNGSPVGKMALVDLAGSERGADTGNLLKKERREGCEINKSLLALKECIRALYQRRMTQDSSYHIPFRDSKLTQILRDSFIGKHSQTAIIAAVCPSSSSVENTLNTLRYADRVKEFQDTDDPGVSRTGPKPTLQKKPSLPSIRTLDESCTLTDLPGPPGESHIRRQHAESLDKARALGEQLVALLDRATAGALDPDSYVDELKKLVEEQLCLWGTLKDVAETYQGQ